MSTIDSFKTFAKKMTQVKSSYLDELGRLRGRVGTLEEKLQALFDAPLPESEIELRARGAVKEDGDEWLSRWGTSLISGDKALAAYGAQGSVQLPDYGRALTHWGALCAADPDAAVKFLMKLVKKVPFEAGPAAAKRPGLTANMRQELDGASAEEERLVDDLIEIGIVVAHRPEVLARRATEARQRELEERETANRKARQDEMDRVYQDRRRR